MMLSKSKLLAFYFILVGVSGQSCTIQDGSPFSDCLMAGSCNFCCAQSNPTLPNACVNQIGGQPCGKGPAQEDMCSGIEGTGGCGEGEQCCKDQNTNGDFCCVPDGEDCRDLVDGFCTATMGPTASPTKKPTTSPTKETTSAPTAVSF